jgi:ribosomal protein L7/L12
LDYNTLTSEQQEDLIVSGTDFMRTITELWGPEAGMEMWGTIATTVGQDFKGAVFFTMMTGTHLGDVRLIDANVPMYVEVIKTVRQYTGYGLKDAKDACDRCRWVTGATSLHVEKLPVMNKANRREFVNALKALGCKAS